MQARQDYNYSELPEQDTGYWCALRRAVGSMIFGIPSDIGNDFKTRQVCVGEAGCTKEQSMICAKITLKETEQVRKGLFLNQE